MARAKRTTQSNSKPASTQAGSGIAANIMGPRLVLLLATLALLLIGFVMVYSSSSILALNEGVSSETYLIKQLGFAVVGIAGCLVLWKLIPYAAWRGPFIWLAWGISVGLLVMTAVIGTTELGAQRWVNIGPVSLQPSEFAKIAFVLMVAKLLTDYREGRITFWSMMGQAFVLIALPLALLYKSQSDLGTTLICFVGILTVMWLGEVPFRVIVGTLAAGAVAALFALTVGYRSDRLIFMNPWEDGADGLGTGYQLIHSFYAFAEGGLWGVGLGNSREKYLYLPEAETDFIFAIIGEELGLVGALVVIVLFLVFLYAGMKITRLAVDDFGKLLAGGFTVMLVFQAFLNMGCAIGLLPTTGKPLPFISAGGSSLITSLCMLGIILSVSKGSNAPSVYEQRRADLRVVRAESDRSPSARSSQKANSSKSSTRNSTRNNARNNTQSGLTRKTQSNARNAGRDTTRSGKKNSRSNAKKKR